MGKFLEFLLEFPLGQGQLSWFFLISKLGLSLSWPVWAHNPVSFHFIRFFKTQILQFNVWFWILQWTALEVAETWPFFTNIDMSPHQLTTRGFIGVSHFSSSTRSTRTSTRDTDGVISTLLTSSHVCWPVGSCRTRFWNKVRATVWLGYTHIINETLYLRKSLSIHS
jgi:hypothetical protein